MTTIKTFVGTVALLAASTVFAQTSSCVLFPKGDEDGQGTIGRRYADGYLSIQDVRGTTTNVYGGGGGANIPLCSGIDLNGGVGYTSYKPDDFSTTLTTLGGNVKFYNKAEGGVKPFVTGGLGMTFGDVNSHSTSWVDWNVGVGAEFPYKWISITPSITYHDDFRHNGVSTQSLHYAVDFNSWATSQVGVYAKVVCIDTWHDANPAFGLALGVRVRF